MTEPTPRTPPPRWPDRRNGVAAPPSWNLPTQPLRQMQERSGRWWPYAMFGGITLMIGCFAMIVVVLAR